MLTYALIGCGRISPNHIAAVKNNAEKVHITALCDVDEQAAQALVKRFALQNIHIYTDYHLLLEKEHPDLVAIALPSGLHATVAYDCIIAGCHTIVEKPIALSLADAQRLITAAEKADVRLCACHQNRFNKSIQQIRSALEAGRFGRLFHGAAHIRWNRGKEYYKQAPWRGTWDGDGGALMNQCIHNIDLLRWMMGDEVEEVVAYTDRLAHPFIEAEDLGLALIRFKNGAYGLLEGTTNVFPQNLEETLYLFGETGTVKVGGKSVNKIETWRFADGKEDEEQVKAEFAEDPPNIYGFGHTPLYADMIDAIENHRAPAVDGAAGKRALELVLAVYKAAALGRPVRLPLSDGSTQEFKGRFPFNPQA
ncbi:MAG TPA: oxidoreductase [Ruminococcaceae bacterium]|nr:oxidoreductase [Oscillospiraceae bacterium]